MTARHILLVEDNPHDAALTRIGFKRASVVNPIVHVKNGEEALHYLFADGQYNQRDLTDLPVAVVLDLKLPKISGLEVLKGIRAHELTRTLPVLILSSSKEAQDTKTCQELGITQYFQKPVSFLEFEQAVKQIAEILLQLSSQEPTACSPHPRK